MKNTTKQKRNIYASILLCLLVLGLVGFVHQVSAAPDIPATPGIVIPRFQNPDTNIGELVKKLYEIAIGLVGFAVFIQFIHAGFTYFLAAGNVGETHKGKEIMQNAVLGAILLLSAWLILNVINPDLVRTDLFRFPTLTSENAYNPFPEFGDSGITGQQGAIENADRNMQRAIARMAASCKCTVDVQRVTDKPGGQEARIQGNKGVYEYASSFTFVRNYDTGVPVYLGSVYQDSSTGIQYFIERENKVGGEFFGGVRMIIPNDS